MQVGRGLRIPDDVENLVVARQAGIPVEKSDCILLDVVDNTGRHSLVTVATMLGAPPKVDLKGKTFSEIAGQIEQIQKANPDVDLTQLTEVADLDALRTRAEHVQLFDIRFDPVIEKNSQLAWLNDGAGGYRLRFPNKRGEYLLRPEGEKWRLTGRLDTTLFNEGDLDDLPAAIMYAEMNLMINGKDMITLLRREAPREVNPISPLQAFQLRRLRLVDSDIRLLSARQARKVIGRGFRRRT